MRKLIILNIFLLLVIAGSGLLLGGEPETRNSTNVNNQEVELFGTGVYKNESLFRAPIYKGTDFVMLTVVVPLMILLSFLKSIKSELLSLGVNGLTLYYSINLAFGTLYNHLFIVYLVFFSLNLFLFIVRFIQVCNKINMYPINYPKKFNVIFLAVAGCSVFVWLIEIINSLITGTPPAIIGMASTEVTYIVDLGMIAPSAFITVYLIIKENILGLISGLTLTILNFFVGLIVISQALMQSYYNVSLEAYEIIGYILPFVIMSVVASTLIYKTMKSIDSNTIL